MLNEKEILFKEIKDYSIILDDYINRRFKYTLNTEDLEDEIKVVSACLLETINEFEQILLEESN